MSDFREIITVGFDKNSDADFRISAAALMKLEYKEMNELRAMITVAIGTTEQMWRVENEKRHLSGCVTPTNAEQGE